MDLTVVAIPGFFGSMAYESWWLRRRAEQDGPSPVDYERNDTIASLTMGTGSLVIPLLTSRFSRNFELGRGRWATPLLTVGLAAAAATAVADAVARSAEREAGSLRTVDRGSAPAGTEAVPVPGDAAVTGESTAHPDGAGSGRAARLSRWARRIGGSTAVAAIAATGVTAASTWAARTSAQRLHQRRVLPDLGNGPFALAVAVLGWDFIYYWNHRIQHESRVLWAIHVVHHSSERYNLSTALRQPWAESLGMFVPYGLLSLLGVRPNLIETARQVNLLYQFWIHTDAIRSIGPLEEVLNTPSHHRAHHGSNRRYLDRNHGSILIVWDRLFGTFQRELDEDPVVYGLTKNIETFNPVRIATHEYVDIVSDVAQSRTWSDRLSFVLRGPGWAYERRPGRPGGEAAPVEAATSAA
jgi:sterol desaturase/sphingolipid hydroxylase (fatty acid hydroxylase superfamily)